MPEKPGNIAAGMDNGQTKEGVAMAQQKILIADLMSQSGVKFGTSGARGLVSDMTDMVCYSYTVGFIQYLEQTGELLGSGPMGVAGDLRPSTDRIMAAVGEAIRHKGYTPINLGKIPSPALALWGITKKIPTAMVTGSHIPDDRNGIKYTKKQGEILKPDEAGITSQTIEIPRDLFDSNGMFRSQPALDDISTEGLDLYTRRYLEFFPAGCLDGKRIGVYQHSAVGREIVVNILEGLGATVKPLGWSDKFIPVDTEAIRHEDRESAKNWVKEYALHAIVSTDGDSDRPMVSDENGQWLRGDIAGIICASYLGADSVVTPVSCNSSVEKSGFFKEVIRTRIGSPYVIEAMIEAEEKGAEMVVGYEANGGFLLQSPVRRFGASLAPLPTRDALIVHLSVLLSSIEKSCPISNLLDRLPARFTYSDRLKHFPNELAHEKLSKLHSGDFENDSAAIEKLFASQFGKVVSIDNTDGVRITFDNQDVVHLRPSGNAPEFRCYTESGSVRQAKHINALALDSIRSWLKETP